MTTSTRSKRAKRKKAPARKAAKPAKTAKKKSMAKQRPAKARSATKWGMPFFMVDENSGRTWLHTAVNRAREGKSMVLK